MARNGWIFIDTTPFAGSRQRKQLAVDAPGQGDAQQSDPQGPLGCAWLTHSVCVNVQDVCGINSAPPIAAWSAFLTGDPEPLMNATFVTTLIAGRRALLGIALEHHLSLRAASPSFMPAFNARCIDRGHRLRRSIAITTAERRNWRGI
jgi:hypothetical protein